MVQTWQILRLLEQRPEKLYVTSAYALCRTSVGPITAGWWKTRFKTCTGMATRHPDCIIKKYRKCFHQWTIGSVTIVFSRSAIHSDFIDIYFQENLRDYHFKICDVVVYSEWGVSERCSWCLQEHPVGYSRSSRLLFAPRERNQVFQTPQVSQVSHAKLFNTPKTNQSVCITSNNRVKKTYIC